MTDEEFTQRLNAIDQEPDETKRRRLVTELSTDLAQGMAQATVAIVEQVRARSGDEAALETLKALRRARPKPTN